jgi:hypothetical protein
MGEGQSQAKLRPRFDHRRERSGKIACPGRMVARPPYRDWGIRDRPLRNLHVRQCVVLPCPIGAGCGGRVDIRSTCVGEYQSTGPRDDIHRRRRLSDHRRQGRDTSTSLCGGSGKQCAERLTSGAGTRIFRAVQPTPFLRRTSFATAGNVTSATVMPSRTGIAKAMTLKALVGRLG